ncbi:MAG: Lrp/AsnC family transcriptional regulator [Pseudomonadota bacterium]
MEALDSFDLAILRLMQANARLKTEAIAEEVGLSATAVQRRIKRLRDAKIIASEVAVLDAEKLGGLLTAVVGVTLHQGSPDAMASFQKRIQREDAVQQCYWVTGGYDFVLIVTAPRMSDYEALAQSLFIENAAVRRFDTFVALSAPKASLSIPL